MFDHNFLFMAFLMLCFAGLATMFYFMMRNIDDLTRLLKEDRNQMQTNLRALESSLNHLADLLSRLTASEHLPRGAAPMRPDVLRPPASPASMPGAMSGSAAMPSSSPLSGPAPMPGSAPLPGAARAADSGPPDPTELRSAMFSPLQLGDAGLPDGFGRSSPAGSGASGAYGGLSFASPGGLDVDLGPRPTAAQVNGASAPGVGRSAVGLSLSGASLARPAPAQGSSGQAEAVGQAPESGISALPNLSLDNGARPRRR